MSETADCRDPAWDLLEKGRKYLAEGDLHQASEKGWGAAAHMAKAVAAARGWEYDTHADFSQVLYQVRRLSGDVHLLGLRGIANDLHSNYYKRKVHLAAGDIGEGLDGVAELLAILAPLTEPE